METKICKDIGIDRKGKGGPSTRRPWVFTLISGIRFAKTFQLSHQPSYFFTALVDIKTHG